MVLLLMCYLLLYADLVSSMNFYTPKHNDEYRVISIFIVKTIISQWGYLVCVFIVLTCTYNKYMVCRTRINNILQIDRTLNTERYSICIIIYYVITGFSFVQFIIAIFHLFSCIFLSLSSIFLFFFVLISFLIRIAGSS